MNRNEQFNEPNFVYQKILQYLVSLVKQGRNYRLILLRFLERFFDCLRFLERLR